MIFFFLHKRLERQDTKILQLNHQFLVSVVRSDGNLIIIHLILYLKLAPFKVAGTTISASLYTDAGPHTTHFNHRRVCVCVRVCGVLCMFCGGCCLAAVSR